MLPYPTSSCAQAKTSPETASIVHLLTPARHVVSNIEIYLSASFRMQSGKGVTEPTSIPTSFCNSRRVSAILMISLLSR